MERGNLNSEGASARFLDSDPIFDMEEAYVSRPDKSQVEGQTDCFSQLPEGASASSPQARPTPIRAREADQQRGFPASSPVLLHQWLENLETRPAPRQMWV